MRKPKRMGGSFVRVVTRPGTYGDGSGGYGLTLRVRQRKHGGVTKSWTQRIRICGRVTNIGLGTYPIVSLAMARDRAFENRRAVAEGEDPRNMLAEVPTLSEALEDVIALHQPGWKSGEREARIWRSCFRTYVLPALGNRPVSDISPADVLGVVQPLWNARLVIGGRVRQRLSVVMKWCIAKGFRTDNPAGEAVSIGLPRQRAPTRHYRALHYTQAAGALHTVRASSASLVTKLCFEYLVLTAARSGEARLAQWQEVDFDMATWKIPGTRMKAGKPHRVPLSGRALEVLQEADAIRNECGLLVFPSVSGKPISDATLSKLMRVLEIKAVPHGWRSTFRDWAAENTDAPRAVMEAALAHKLGDAVEQAYARSDLFEKRRDLMQQWADYLHPPK